MARPFHILVVEDNPADQRLTLEALKNGKWQVTSTVVEDGEQAWAYLTRQGKYAGATVPDLILLDLNLPGIDGRELLERAKANRDLKRIPVVVLTTSHAAEDVRCCYDLGANSYVIKPSDLDEFFSVMQSIEQYWFSTVVISKQ